MTSIDLSAFEHVIHPDGRLLVRVNDRWLFVDRVKSGLGLGI